jgi:hypothetical protein
MTPRAGLVPRGSDAGSAGHYPAAPHGITATHQGQVNADMLAFFQS